MAKDRITKARALRSNQTEAEKRLWYHLRDSTEFAGKFRRQVPIDIYIVDFACLARRLIIEVDGGQHRPDVDAVRQRHLETQGFKVIRFWNNDVLRNTEGVLTRIRAALDE
ncbi:MAG: DUF559 domain-containing protein [Alphaproteobacteria bacterium]|nr:DUF559 domain-containing protein [Alphaproteobacteria bacterium]